MFAITELILAQQNILLEILLRQQTLLILAKQKAQQAKNSEKKP